MPFSPLHLVIIIFILGLILAMVQIGLLTLAFEKLGLSAHSAFLLLFSSLIGSMINLPLVKIEAERPPLESIPEQLRILFHNHLMKFTGKTLIAVNVGGCLIPLFFSYYLIQYHKLSLLPVAAAITLVSLVCYFFSRPVPGIGIGMPMLIAPIAAALAAVIILPEQSAPLAYICGTLGVIIGADLARLKDIRKMGAPVASIGGAGTFDGIFITGIVAVLLA